MLHLSADEGMKLHIIMPFPTEGRSAGLFLILLRVSQCQDADSKYFSFFLGGG